MERIFRLTVALPVCVLLTVYLRSVPESEHGLLYWLLFTFGVLMALSAADDLFDLNRRDRWDNRQ